VAIAEACNGLRMVFALFLVSAAFAFGTPLRTFVRVILILASPISALFCNVVRLVPTVWLYGSDPEFASTFHDVSGWLMLPLAFLVLMGIIRALRWALLPVYRYTLAYGT
jgi:exosortase/archaeosortase family protein